jgi:hypothetical protein
MAGKLVLDIINAQGTKLMTAKKIYIRDGKVAMDGVLMGTMPGQFYITPLDLYKATKMIDFEFVKGAVGLLWQGRKEYKAQLAAEQAKAAGQAPATAGAVK